MYLMMFNRFRSELSRPTAYDAGKVLPVSAILGRYSNIQYGKCRKEIEACVHHLLVQLTMPKELKEHH